MDKQEMIQMFIDEAVEHLEEMSNRLMELEKEPANNDIIQVLFRSAHTLKGNSTTAYNTLLDYDINEQILNHIKNIGLITHAFESLITEVRENQLPLTSDRIEVLFETENAIETLLTYVEQEIPDEVSIEDIYEKLIQAAKKDDPVSKEKKSVSAPSVKDKVEIQPGEFITYEIILNLSEEEQALKQAYLSLVYADIRDKYEPSEEGVLLRFTPTFDDLMEGKNFEKVFFELDHQFTKEEVISFVEKKENVQEIRVVSSIETPKNEPSISVTEKPSIVDAINNTISKTTETKTPVKSNMISNTNIRVDIKRIDEVLKHVSSLVILKNKLSTYASVLSDEEIKILKDVSEEISQTVDFLQESVMKIRMTPLEQLFQRFPKDVRKIAKEYNKKVAFEHKGGATEIDKSLLDHLGNPLIHLIRNSVFHGLESEVDRIESGKDPVGKLTLSARHEQGWVIITVEDDGKGIDVEKVVKKSIEKGIISEEKAKSLKHEEAIQLIFYSGLSTAEKVTDVAGRGVGMDAVKATIEDELKGTVQVYSQLGKGTKTVIRLPLTLAIIDAMRTKINEEEFAFPISQVEEIVSIHPKEIKYVANKEIYILRDKEIPIVRLNDYFNLNCPKDENAMINMVILKSGDKTIAATVDEFISQENIVVKNIGKYIGNITGISGCTILGDGSISLIVDVNNLFNI